MKSPIFFLIDSHVVPEARLCDGFSLLPEIPFARLFSTSLSIPLSVVRAMKKVTRMPFHVDLVNDAETPIQCVRRLFQTAVFFAELRRDVY
jgi:hypothetical protein